MRFSVSVANAFSNYLPLDFLSASRSCTAMSYTSGGTIDPQVLSTDDGARAIALRLEAGQLMNDHQVRERAWLVVVEGEAEIRCGDDVVQGGVGTLATFAPGERHAVSTGSGARLLLLLEIGRAHV